LTGARRPYHNGHEEEVSPMKLRSIAHRASRARAEAALAAAALLLSALPASAGWERFHGDGANRGFVDVTTAPAAGGSRSVPGLGTFAPGAGPVIAPDGTVYLGTIEGKVIALHADGSPFWSRDITPGQAITASPAVGADGSVYVVGTKTTKVRDNRVSPPKIQTVFEATLHKFTSSGGWIAQTPFPNHGGGAATSAAPNIMRSGSVVAVIVPAIYRNVAAAAIELRLIAFSTGGAVLADQRVTFTQGVATGGGSLFPELLICLPPVGTVLCLTGVAPSEYTPPSAAAPPPLPMPGAAVFTFAFAQGDPPRVVVNDGMHDVVGYTFSPNGLTEAARTRLDTPRLISPPLVLPDGDTLVGTADGAAVFGGLSLIKQTPVTGLGTVVGAPTQTVSGLIAVVGTRAVALLRDAKVLSRAPLPTPSYTSAAASRTHVFVSTIDAFLSFDAEAQLPLKTFDWVGGGLWPPAIGPQGHVYAIASNILFVFPPPKSVTQPPQSATAQPEAGTKPKLGGVKVAPAVGVLQPKGQGTASPPASQVFQPPLVASGKRLYACKDLSNKSCGEPVAASFCQQQGFARAGEIDTAREKVQAETLGGQVCTKGKCRVFEKIVCTN
jgi:hypothetical protein